MRKGQTSVEYLLLTAGVILIGVIASQAVVSSSTATHAAIEEEINAHVVPSDVTPPSTEIICDGATCLSKYNRDVDVGFVCTDNVGGVGCAKTYYDVKKDGSPYKSGSCDQTAGKCANVVTLQAPPAGNKYTYTITFYSEDLNGNVESPNQVVIEIGVASSGIMTSCSLDWAPEWPRPGDTISVTGRVSSGILQNATLTLAGSTLNASYNCGTLDDKTKPECTQSGIILPSSPSSYTVSVTISGTDIYGNTGDCTTDTIIVDGEPPSVSITNPDACKWYRTDFTADVTATDNPSTNASDIISWEYSISDGVDPEYTSGVQTYLSAKHTTSESFTVTVGPGKYCEEQGEKVCNVSASFTDRAGNTGTDKKEYSIDYTPPTTTVNYTKYGWTSSDITITFTCTDSPANGSGCDRIEYILDDTLSTKNDKSGTLNFTKTGTCPPKGPISGTETLNITCPSGEVCKYKLTYTTYDVAGNQDGPHTLYINIDSEGAYLIDKRKPREDISPATDGWTNQPINITLSCSDGSGSGCKANFYTPKDYKQEVTLGTAEYPHISVDPWAADYTITYNGCPSSASGTATLDCTDGDVCVWYVFYGAEDCVGNWSSAAGTLDCAVRGVSPYCYGGPYKIDKEIPVTTVDKYAALNEYYKSADNAYYYSSYVVQVTCDDNPNGRPAVSGCNQIYWEVTRPDLYKATPSSGTESVSGDSDYVRISLCSDGLVCFVNNFRAYSVDVAGNQSDWNYLGQYNFYVDKQAPDVAIIPEKHFMYSDETVQITVDADDCYNSTHCAGLDNVKIKINGVVKKTQPADVDPFIWSTTLSYQDFGGTGQFQVCAVATDHVGNTAEDCTQITVRSACQKIRSGDQTWEIYCDSLSSSNTCGDSTWTLDSCGSCNTTYCSDSRTAAGTKTCTYTGYTGACKLNASGSPYCETTTCSTTESCTLPCDYGEECCGGSCYTSGTGVCCNGTWYSGYDCCDMALGGECCDLSDCSPYCSGDVLYTPQDCYYGTCKYDAGYDCTNDNYLYCERIGYGNYNLRLVTYTCSNGKCTVASDEVIQNCNCCAGGVCYPRPC